MSPIGKVISAGQRSRHRTSRSCKQLSCSVATHCHALDNVSNIHVLWFSTSCGHWGSGTERKALSHLVVIVDLVFYCDIGDIAHQLAGALRVQQWPGSYIKQCQTMTITVTIRARTASGKKVKTDCGKLTVPCHVARLCLSHVWHRDCRENLLPVVNFPPNLSPSLVLLQSFLPALLLPVPQQQ